MKLYLCEKPSQAKDIANILGSPIHQKTHIKTNEGLVTWAFGHLLELAPPEIYDESLKRWSRDTLPILPSKFEIRPKADRIEQLNSIGRFLKKCTELIISTDPDREGEMIAREILDYLHFRGKIARLWLAALDPTSIRIALGKLKQDQETRFFYYAALARCRADWLVGINISRAMTLQFSEKGVLSIGRVQTPTLALVVRRDREIENFKPRTYYEIIADLSSGDKMISLRFGPSREEERIFERTVADSLAKRASSFCGPLNVIHERRQTAPPKPFSLASFQIKANRLWGWSADYALRVLQSLYERHKATTYPRSDCEFLPEEQVSDVPVILSNLNRLDPFRAVDVKNPIIRKTVFDTSKITAHHAIVPTTAIVDLSAFSEDEVNGFLLISRHYIASLMADYEFDHTSISLKIEEKLTFSTTGNVAVIPGWKTIFGREVEEEDTQLPPIEDKTLATIEQIQIESKKTKAPSHYTEGSLIADMKNIAKFVTDPSKKARLREASGLGTEATRAGILKTLHDREFLEAKKKTVLSTERGRKLICLLEEHLPILTDPGETAVWEDFLESIASGKKTIDEFTNLVAGQVKSYVKTLFTIVPSYQTTGIVFEGKEILDGGNRWIFLSRKGWFPKELFKRKMSPEDYIKVLGEEKRPKFDGFISSQGKKFSARLKYNPSRVYNGKSAPGIESIFDK